MSQMETNRFSISVVIPAYNAGKYLGRTIESVLAQSRAPDEIIIVDDGSTDNTADVAAGYGAKIKYIHQENAGASAARNAGINAASSEWIAFLDSDDEWLKDHLQGQTELLSRNPDLVWSTGNFYLCLCDENKRNTRIAVAKAKRGLAGKDYFDNYFAAYIAGCGGWTGTMVINRGALIEAGLFREGQAKANDLDMWWRLAYRHPNIGYEPEPSAIYHMVVPNSITQGYFSVELYCELISRHLCTAADSGCRETFERFAATILRRWMRAMLFDARGGDIRKMIKQFQNLLPAYYKITMQLLTAFPKTTAWGCHMISRIVRTLNLRRKITRRPSK